ncbi:MAG: transketolase [Eubacteriaceae bacterium]
MVNELTIISELEKKTNDVRKLILEMINKAHSGHPGGSFSAAEIVTTLYFHLMNIDPNNPHWSDRDRFILSKGHACPVLYANLALRGYFSVAETANLRCLGSKCQGHPDMNKLAGLDASTGALGEGLSVGVGMALVGKLDQKNYIIYVMVGDGEVQEGQIWEAAMSASKYKLDNLITFLDYNKIQVDGFVEDVMPIEPLKDKWLSFGWDVQEIDGHSIKQIILAVKKAKEFKGKPHIIISNTTKGKGVSFMENTPKWHSGAFTKEEYYEAIRELEGKI